jgi:hypothetical protein
MRMEAPLVLSTPCSWRSESTRQYHHCLYCPVKVVASWTLSLPAWMCDTNENKNPAQSYAPVAHRSFNLLVLDPDRTGSTVALALGCIIAGSVVHPTCVDLNDVIS